MSPFLTILGAVIAAGVALVLLGRRFEHRMQVLEPRILRLLASNPEGMYARNIIQFLGPLMADAAVYEVIVRLVDKGMVSERRDPFELGQARRRYFITDAGLRAIATE